MQLLSDVVKAFTDSGVQVAHVRFHDTPAPPYARTYLSGSHYSSSDNRVRRTLCEYDVVLYVIDRDLELEGAIEAALDAARVPYQKIGGYVADDDLVTTTFSVEVYER